MRPVLLDTMTVLWMCFRPEWLGTRAARVLEDSESRLSYSIVSIWEIGIKLSKGGYGEFVLPEDWDSIIPDHLDGMQIQRQGVAPAHCRRIQDLPFHHKDPFDRMLIAQALESGCDMLTIDEIVEKYGVLRIW